MVKLERVAGALETERCALTWLTAHAGPAPHLRSAARIRQAGGASRLCLISDLAGGEAPQSEQAWERFGVALAGLPDLPWRGSGLRIYDHAEFVAGHQARIRDLGDGLSEPLNGVVDLDWLMSGPVPVATPLVLTHGDPGPGNFLDDGGRGTLLDWEEAQVAPLGLDLARAMFIALPGVGPTGLSGPRPCSRLARCLSGLPRQLGLFLDAGALRDALVARSRRNPVRSPPIGTRRPTGCGVMRCHRDTGRGPQRHGLDRDLAANSPTERCRHGSSQMRLADLPARVLLVAEAVAQSDGLSPKQQR